MSPRQFRRGLGECIRVQELARCRDMRSPTAYDGVWSELEELVLQFLAEPFHVLFLSFVGPLEAFGKGW